MRSSPAHEPQLLSDLYPRTIAELRPVSRDTSNHEEDGWATVPAGASIRGWPTSSYLRMEVSGRVSAPLSPSVENKRPFHKKSNPRGRQGPLDEPGL